jgi:hypothetical protein
MTSVNFRPLYFVPAMFSRIDNREAAWKTLSDFSDPFDDPETRWEPKSRISATTPGFRELLRLIVTRNKMISTLGTTEIQISPEAYTGNGESSIGTYLVELVTEAQPEPIIVAEMGDVDGWIRDERLTWGLSVGFPVLFFGFLVSLIAQVHSARRSRIDLPL